MHVGSQQYNEKLQASLATWNENMNIESSMAGSIVLRMHRGDLRMGNITPSVCCADVPRVRGVHVGPRLCRIFVTVCAEWCLPALRSSSCQTSRIGNFNRAGTDCAIFNKYGGLTGASTHHDDLRQNLRAVIGTLNIIFSIVISSCYTVRPPWSLESLRRRDLGASFW